MYHSTFISTHNYTSIIIMYIKIYLHCTCTSLQQHYNHMSVYSMYSCCMVNTTYITAATIANSTTTPRMMTTLVTVVREVSSELEALLVGLEVVVVLVPDAVPIALLALKALARQVIPATV